MAPISIEITPHRRNFSLMQTNFPWQLSELVEELEQEEWHPYGAATAVQHDVWTGKRFKVHDPKGSKLNQIKRYFASDEARQYVVDCLYRDKPNFAVNWQMYPWRMFQNTVMHAEFTKDLPGFENGIHCDMRRLVATGVVYLAEGDDERVSSCFYDHPDRHNPQRVETGYGKGWIHSNDFDTWHDGWNRGDKNRYSILLGLTLKLEHQPQASDTSTKPGNN